MREHKLGRRGERRYSVFFHPAAEKEFLSLPPKVQTRFEKAINGLETDPYTARPGVDVTKLADLAEGSTLHRLRVGERRACYAIVVYEREVWVLLFDDREIGYERMTRSAQARFKARR